MRKKIQGLYHVSPARIDVVPGGVDTVQFRNGLSSQARGPGLYVLCVGSLQPRKNLGVLLEAWKDVSPRFPMLRLLIAGGEDSNMQRPGLEQNHSRVVFLGYVRDVDLPGLYRNASAYVLPSLDEGFGLTVLEAMSCGAPVIAARAGALPEVVGGAGLLFDPLQPSELAELLSCILTDANLRERLVERGLERAKIFPWERSAEQLWEILQR